MRWCGYIVVLAVNLALAGCGGGGGSAALPVSAPKPSALQHVTIRIDEPAAASAARRAQYISPATTQATIDVEQGGVSIAGYPQMVSLTPTSSGCSSTLANVSCQLTLALAAGSYTLTLTAKDANGNALSAAQNVPFTVVAGTANSVGVSLGGVAASAEIVPNANAEIAGNASAGFSLQDCIGSQTVSVFGLDADGNVILGAGAPSVSLTSDSSALSVTSLGTSNPNAFTLSCNGAVPWNATLHLTATATPPSGSGSAAVSSVIPMTFDRPVSGTITEYSTGYVLPSGIIVLPDGNVWWGEAQTRSLGTIAPDGTNLLQIALTGPAAVPHHGALGPDGDYWTLDYDQTHVDRITFAGAVTQYTAPTGVDNENTITQGPDGAMWFTEWSGAGTGAAIARITTSGTITEFPLPNTSYPAGIVTGPDGNLWFTEAGASKIGRITTSGTITEYTLGTSACPNSIAAGPDGALWFTDSCLNMIGRITTTGTITEYPIPTANSAAMGIVEGPDDAMWFCENGASAVARINMHGGITQFATPTANSQPVDMAVGRDGSIWFTETVGAIGRIR